MSTSRAVRAALGHSSARGAAKGSKKTECACEGLCAACGWNTKRVPRAWLEQGPGTPYPGSSKLIGQRVTLRGDEVASTIVATATPLGETVFQAGRRSERYKCQGAFIVSTPLGRGTIETPVAKSVVRERMRAPRREGNCPDAPVYGGSSMKGFAGAMEREAAKLGRHPHDHVGADLPFPHRKGSTPCCVNSKVSPAQLEALAAAWRESGEESDFFRLQAAVVKALPRSVRAITPVETAADVLEAIETIRKHCWSQWLEHEARTTEPSKTFQKRVRDNRRELARAGLPQTAGMGRRRLESESAAEMLRTGDGSESTRASLRERVRRELVP